jgi:peptidyl-prolyl cis-trans isomerase SurA
MVSLLAKLKPGDYSMPVAYENEQGKKGVRIVHLKSRSTPHRMNFQDDYSKIAQFALEEKKAKVMEKWIQNKLETYYVKIDPGTAEECPQLKKFSADN